MKQLLITIAAVVLVGCRPSVPDISIHDAADEGNIKAVKQHLAAGTDVDVKGGWKYRTALHQAAKCGHKEVAELLIAKGADVNAKDGAGRAPLDKAKRGSRIQQGDITQLANLLRDSPEVIAGRKETADLLRKHGGKTGEELKAEEK